MRTFLRNCKVAGGVMGAVLLLGSCQGDELPQPMKRARTVLDLNTVWPTTVTDNAKTIVSRANSDFSEPENYVIRIGNDLHTVSGNVNRVIVYAGSTYDIVTYNEPQHITISGDIAVVDDTPATGNGATMYGNPGHLFSTSNAVETSESNDTIKVKLAMQQRTHEVKLGLNVPGAKSAEGVLYNVVAGINLATGEKVSVGNVSNSFSVTQAANYAQLSTTFRLLGIPEVEEGETPLQQKFVITLTKNDDTVETIETDLTEELAGLEGNGNTSLEIKGELPIQGNVIDWTVVEGGDLEIEKE